MTFASIPTMAQRQGNLGKPIVNPLTGEVYADGVIPAAAITPFARAGAGRPARRRRAPGIVEQLRLAAAARGLQRQVRRQGRSAVQRARRPAFVRFSHRKVDNFEPPPIPGRDRQPGQRLRRGAQPAGRRRRHVHAVDAARCSRCGSACRAPRPARPRSAPAARTCSSATASPACRPTRVFAGGLTAAVVTGWTAWGRQNSNPQFQDPFVVNPRINYSWITRPPQLQDRLRVPGDQHRDRRLQPEVRRATPTAASSAVRPARRPTRRPTTSPTSCSARAAPTTLINPFVVQPPPADALRLRAGRLARSRRQLTLNLGLRYEFAHAAVGGGQLPDQLRSGDQHADPGEGRLDLRPRAGQSRSQQLRAAPRRRLQRRRRRRSSAPATASATSTSTGSAARTCSRSTARTSCRSPSPSSRRRGSAPATRRRRPASGRRSRAIRRA